MKCVGSRYNWDDTLFISAMLQNKQLTLQSNFPTPVGFPPCLSPATSLVECFQALREVPV
jgi:hypothetical protein